MRRLGIVAVGLALVVGIIIDGTAGNLLTASADPAAPNPGHTWSEIGDLPGTMWHSNNDGSGSGLDADMLDGRHADQTGANYIPYADASGNVGIGTTTPVGKLQIEGDFSASNGRPLRIKNTDTGTSAHAIFQAECSSASNMCQPGINFVRPSGTAWEVSVGAGDNATDFLGFARIDAGPGVFMVIAPSGNVGVGTTSPQSKLQVAGDYIQFPTRSGSAPPAGDCDSSTEAGRMVVRTDGATNLYVCTGTGGWVGK